MGKHASIQKAYSLALALKEHAPEAEQERLMREYIALCRQETAGEPTQFLTVLVGNMMLAEGALVSGAISVLTAVTDEPDDEKAWSATKLTANTTLNMIEFDDEEADDDASLLPPVVLPSGPIGQVIAACWPLVAAYADSGATAEKKLEIITDLLDRYDPAVVVGALGYFSGAVMLSMVAHLLAADLDELREEIGGRIAGGA